MALFLHREIERLKKQILSLSKLVETSVQMSVRAVKEFDTDLAKKVIEKDTEIDNAEMDVEEEVLKILALYQPVAVDLRFIVTVLKMNSDLERIGDLAVNIAKRTFLFKPPHPQAPLDDFVLMGDKVMVMLQQVLDAMVNMDSGLAEAVRVADDEVDDLNRKIYDQIKEGILSEPERVHTWIHFLSVSRFLERIADHCTTIAENLIYTIEGDIVRHQKQDDF